MDWHQSLRNESAVFGNVMEMDKFDLLEKFSLPRKVRLSLGNKIF